VQLRANCGLMLDAATFAKLERAAEVPSPFGSVQ
jgi:hypothetical protein